MRHFLLHYGEIALKNRNRSFFEEKLRRQIERKLRDTSPCQVHKRRGRFILEFIAPPRLEIVKEKLSKIFGLVNFIPCGVTEPTLEEFKKHLNSALEKIKLDSFAVRARRGEKTFPLSSQFVNEEIGTFVKEKTGAPVRLDDPATTIHIELFEDKIFFGLEKIRGLGGLPVGVAGKVATLLSGGIDSPVAAWRMMKRGCESLFIHFHSAPFTTVESEEKTLDLAEVLSSYQEGSVFISVPFGEIQRKIIAKTPEAYRVLLYRRLMLRIAEIHAREYRAQALVTGESLSQVASQTLPNLASIESIATLPVLRPLIGMDKEEIVREAQKIGTYTISIRPHPDCCSFMIPKRPKTRSRIEDLDRIEKQLDLDALVGKGVKESKVIHI